MPRSAGYRHHEDTRKKIKAQQLINRLQALLEREPERTNVAYEAYDNRGLSGEKIA